jgi:hypothetical protein
MRDGSPAAAPLPARHLDAAASMRPWPLPISTRWLSPQQPPRSIPHPPPPPHIATAWSAMNSGRSWSAWCDSRSAAPWPTAASLDATWIASHPMPATMPWGFLEGLGGWGGEERRRQGAWARDERQGTSRPAPPLRTAVRGPFAAGSPQAGRHRGKQ